MKESIKDLVPGGAVCMCINLNDSCWNTFFKGGLISLRLRQKKTDARKQVYKKPI